MYGIQNNSPFLGLYELVDEFTNPWHNLKKHARGDIYIYMDIVTTRLNRPSGPIQWKAPAELEKDATPKS